MQTSNGTFDRVGPQTLEPPTPRHPMLAPWAGGPKWEYQQVLCPPHDAVIQQACAECGQCGWELAGMMVVQQEKPGMVNGVIGMQIVPLVLLQFKRPLPA